MTTRLLIGLLGASLLPAQLGARTPPKRVKAVRVHAYVLSSSTWIGVDSSQIQYAAPLKKSLPEPARFMSQLEAALATRDTLALREFRPQFVRFWFHVSYRGGGRRSIYVAQGSTLLLGRRLYRLDEALKELLRAYLPMPAPDEYLPRRPVY